MELTFIVSSAAIFLMVALRSLEIRFQRPIILAQLSWPVEKRLRIPFKKIPGIIENITSYFAEARASIRFRIAAKISSIREDSADYFISLQESLRGKRALSRGSVSFFLLNISDYGNNRNKEAVTVPVEEEARGIETEESL